jgi:YhgE/Pip-like protein
VSPASRSAPDARALLRHGFAWSLVALGAVLAMTMTFSYLYGFLEPTRRLQNLPVGIVNLDQGSSFAGTPIRAGEQVVAGATRPAANPGNAVRWHVYRTQAELVSKIHDISVYGGFVLPPDFSAQIVSAGTSLGRAPPAHVNVLASSGVGFYGRSVFDTVSAKLVRETSAAVRSQIVAQLQQAGVRLAPSSVAVLGTPVVARLRDLTPINDHSGRGLAPFYFALMMTLAGYVATVAISVGVDVLAGHEEFDVLGRIIRFPDQGVSESARWRAKFVVVMATAPAAAALMTVMAVNVLGMQTSSWFKTFLFAWLGVAAIANITLVFLTAFGLIGELLAVIFITIFGVPSALGVFPEYALPGFFRFTASWHPMRYESDGARAIQFFDARGSAGLTTAVIVLFAWLIGAILAGGVLARVVDTLRAKHPKVFGAVHPT